MKTATTCPAWCAGGHHCTARLGKGSHASTPEMWDTDIGRVIATRHLHSRGAHVELRIVVPLPGGEEEAVGFMRTLIASAYEGIARAVGIARRRPQA